jgi:hypothetical protein
VRIENLAEAEMDPETYDYAVWWSDEDAHFLACAIGLQAGTGYGTTPEKALKDAIAIARDWLATDGHAPRIFPLSQGVPAWTPELLRELRRSLPLTQEEFAELLNVGVQTVRSWEQGWRPIEGGSARLLDFVAATPGLVRKWAMERERRSGVAASA